MLDYKLLEALAVVFETGSFETAAKQLHLTQSAISQRIKLLETRCGQPLLIRTSPVQATPKGQQLLKHYRKVSLLEDELWSAFDDQLAGFVSLPIAVNADSMVTWFVDAIAEKAQQSQWLLDLAVEDQDETLRLLKTGEAIGCITAESQPPQGCRCEPLGTMRYRCVATKEFLECYFSAGFGQQAIEKAPAVTFNSKDRLHDEFLKKCWNEFQGVYPKHRLPSTGTFLKAIKMGLGYGLVPDLMLGSLIRTGELIDLEPEHAFGVDLYWQCWGVDTPLVRELSSIVIQAGRTVLSQDCQ
ncbi:LysR family transcriptional regulator ArgP [Motiliproteus sp. MSK22-1]|uniref:LysR family transcriptional regulator ArgP n=1 Tax=Motiliproteus sp. MSK22-1 TaxID=1897630 RepID=UPI000978CBE7|nr:LysR family transcriptional regulator ArgP [Motiliproteus sp. MSK22-1]OMH25269.1 transcriptional regulator ArgP [Motiliproteus sp. MSK22-1]